MKQCENLFIYILISVWLNLVAKSQTLLSILHIGSVPRNEKKMITSMSKGRTKQSKRVSWILHMETTWKRTKTFRLAIFILLFFIDDGWGTRMSMIWLCISKDIFNIQFSIRCVWHSPNEPNPISIFICERIFKWFELLMDYNRDKESIELLGDIESHLSRFIHIVVHSLNEYTRTKTNEKSEKKNVYCHTTMNL